MSEATLANNFSLAGDESVKTPLSVVRNYVQMG